jgi:hypothetical protein
MEQIRAVQTATRLVLGQPEESNALSMRGISQLNDAEFDLLNTLMKQMQAYYPHQEFLQETVEGYQFDMERLAVKFGIHQVREVLLDLRLRAGQRFFPHPVQVLEELEAMAEKERMANRYQPDPACAHNQQRPQLGAGWVWATDAEGTRVAAPCNCWLIHHGKPPRPEARPPVEDRKEAAAGVGA